MHGVLRYHFLVHAREGGGGLAVFYFGVVGDASGFCKRGSSLVVLAPPRSPRAEISEMFAWG